MLPHTPPLLHCLTNRVHTYLIGFSVIRGDYAHPTVPRNSPTKNKTKHTQQSFSTLPCKSTPIVAAKNTGAHLTHIWSRCSDPHLTSLHSSEPVNFTIPHPLLERANTRWLPSGACKQKKRSETSTCIRGIMPRSCVLSVRSGLCCGSFRAPAH